MDIYFALYCGNLRQITSTYDNLKKSWIKIGWKKTSNSLVAVVFITVSVWANDEQGFRLTFPFPFLKQITVIWKGALNISKMADPLGVFALFLCLIQVCVLLHFGLFVGVTNAGIIDQIPFRDCQYGLEYQSCFWWRKSQWKLTWRGWRIFHWTTIFP